MKTFKIPEATIMRLSVYSRYLDRVARQGVITISSGEIAEGVGVSPAQFRKDLAYFGEFGTRGVGYNVKDLHRNILKILGLNNDWPVVIVGVGNLGAALSMYKGFQQRGFKIVGIFEEDHDKIGQRLADKEILPMSSMEEVILKHKAKIGIIAVPADYAQEVANMLISFGVKAILNFAPRMINVPEDVELRNVDLAVNLEVLTFNVGANKK